MATNIVSAIALKELVRQRRFSLTRNEQEKMIAIANADKKYSVCFTCTSHFDGTIEQLFVSKGAPAYALIVHTLFNVNSVS